MEIGKPVGLADFHMAKTHNDAIAILYIVCAYDGRREPEPPLLWKRAKDKYYTN